MIARTGVPGRSRASATARIAMSRSVIMPVSRSFSHTGSEPTSSSRINDAALVKLASGAMQRAPLVMISRTFMGAVYASPAAGDIGENLLRLPGGHRTLDRTPDFYRRSQRTRSLEVERADLRA